MNLNLNQRIEFYEISEGSEISGYLKEIVDYHFALPEEDSFSAFKDFSLKENVKKNQQKRLDGWD